jgi:hypothetical protein
MLVATEKLRDGPCSLVRRVTIPRKVIITVLLFLCLVAGINGIRYWPSTHSPFDYYQSQFGPAVALACKGRLENLIPVAPSPLSDFLALKRSSLNCADLGPVREAQIELFHYQIYGFLELFGRLWQVFGIDWNIARYVAAAFYVLLVIAVYCLVRTIVSPVIALGITAAFLVVDQWTPALIGQLRDYSKAPFILLLIALCVFCSRWGGRRLLIGAFGSGFLLGVGLGFRSDMSVFIFILPIVLLLRAIFQRGRPTLLAAIGLYAAALIFVNLFVFRFSPGLGRNFPHWFLLGQTGVFMKPAIGVLNGSTQLPSVYLDLYTWELVSLFNLAHHLPLPPYASIDYDQAGMHFILQLAILLPADFLIKAYVAASESLFYMFQTGGFLQQLAFIVCPAFLLAVCGWRAGLLLILCYGLAAMTFVQFALRHYFVYSMIGFALVCICLAKAIELAAKHVAWHRALRWVRLDAKAY